MVWLLLADGAPREPKSWDWDELMSLPRPDDLLRQLFLELCGVRELPLHIAEQRVVPGEERIATGFCGTSEIGYRLVERECLETSIVPYDVLIETSGLPGMQVRWHYCLEYAGQAGHAAFRHLSLNAQFDNVEAEGRFTRIWQNVFKTIPVWEPGGK